MSIEAMNWALRQKTGSPAAKSVLLILANRADHKGICWPGYNGIAEQTELSRRAVIDNIRKLEKLGLLTVENRPKQKSNLYRLNLSGGAGDALVQELHGAGAAPRSAGAAPLVVQEVHQGSAGAAPEPSLTTNKPKRTIKGKKRSSRVPVKWSPSDKLLNYALEQGMSPEAVKVELENFRDHEFEKPRSDWDACWRTWCRNWKKWYGSKSEPSRARAL